MSGTMRTRKTENLSKECSLASQRQLWPEPQRSQGLWFLLLTRGLRSTWEGECSFGPRCYTKPDNPKAATSMEETLLKKKKKKLVHRHRQATRKHIWVYSGKASSLYRSHNHRQTFLGFRGLHAGYRCP